jgi:hypothetical protein
VVVLVVLAGVGGLVTPVGGSTGPGPVAAGTQAEQPRSEAAGTGFVSAVVSDTVGNRISTAETGVTVDVVDDDTGTVVAADVQLDEFGQTGYVEVAAGQAYRVRVDVPPNRTDRYNTAAAPVEVAAGETRGVTLVVERSLVPSEVTVVDVTPAGASGTADGGDAVTYTVQVNDTAASGGPTPVPGETVGVSLVDARDPANVTFAEASRQNATNSVGIAQFTVSSTTVKRVTLLFESVSNTSASTTATADFTAGSATGSITGQVTNGELDPLAAGQAEVQLFYRAVGASYVPVDRPVKTIDDQGRYAFTDVEAGRTYQVVATAPGGYQGRARAEDLPARTTTADIVVPGATTGEPLLTVGSLRAPDSAPAGDAIAVDATVTNVGNADAVDEPVEFRTDADRDGTLETVASRLVSAGVGEATDVRFEVTVPDIEDGTYAHGVFTADSSQTAALTVSGGNSEQPAGNTTVQLRLDSAPYGIPLMNVTVTATNGAAIVSPPSAPALGSVPLKNSEIERGGAGAANVTVRTVSTGSTVSTDAVTLLNLSFAGTVNESDLTYTVTTLTNTNGSGTGDPIDPARVSLDVTQPDPEPTVFSGPAPGISGAEGAPNDADSDGTFEDVNGDGETDFSDVLDFAFSLSSTDRLTAEQKAAFDSDGDSSGDISFGDVISLAFNLGT